ncbi:MAG TPA: hypothetical protein VLT47_13385 [Anaeromyxobacteraceae bacterium]|nr:hypothetical protein [Anaeromyxobacteraceae bacterium]
MEDLRVPKRRVPVEMILPGGAARRMTLFLSEVAEDHTGPERPSDLLNGGDDFVPAFDEAGKTMTFLNRSTISAVRLDPALDTDVDEDVSLPTEHAVEVLLRDGTALRGLVSFLRPTERSRLVDFLNESPPFFRLLDDSTLVLVNKRHVVRVTLNAE